MNITQAMCGEIESVGLQMKTVLLCHLPGTSLQTKRG
uniref:Uncharacterized protein n=1 Tax=Anguilla anguilla TaxID=7936 RepID=A0A0E9XDJ2_ANGAN